VKIYQKIIKNSDFRPHVAPPPLELASMYCDPVAARADLRAHLMTSLRLYNGRKSSRRDALRKSTCRS